MNDDISGISKVKLNARMNKLLIQFTDDIKNMINRPYSSQTLPLSSYVTAPHMGFGPAKPAAARIVPLLDI